MIPYRMNPLGVNYPPLTLTALDAGSTVKLTAQGNLTITGMLYRTSVNPLWQPYTTGSTVTLSAVGDWVQFRGTSGELSSSTYGGNYAQFVTTGAIEASGNLRSLINYKPMYSWCFMALFKDNTALIEAAKLWIHGNVANGSLHQTFMSCSYLLTPPDLYADEIGYNGCGAIFFNCFRLLYTPKLPAVIIGSSAYTYAFYNCNNMVNTLTILPAVQLAESCYNNMFDYCYSMETAPELPALQLAPECYRGMFWTCRKIKTIKINATALGSLSCYGMLAGGMSSLESVEVNFTDWNTAQNATGIWMQNVAAGGTFIKPAALPVVTGENGIPSTWNIVNK